MHMKHVLPPPCRPPSRSRRKPTGLSTDRPRPKKNSLYNGDWPFHRFPVSANRSDECGEERALAHASDASLVGTRRVLVGLETRGSRGVIGDGWSGGERDVRTAFSSRLEDARRLAEAEDHSRRCRLGGGDGWS